MFLLLLLWLAGAVATIRGLATYGLHDVTHDVALVEYSVILPVLAAAADTPARRLLVFRVLVVAGLIASIVFTAVYFVSDLAGSRIGLDENGGGSVGLYLSLFALPVLVGVVEGARGRWWTLACAAGALVLMSLTVQRSVILALAASLLMLIVLARPKRRLLAAAIAAVALALSVGGAVAIQHLGLGTAPPGASAVELGGTAVLADPNYVADDAGSAFKGGVIVRGDSAAGQASREIRRGEAAQLEEIRGLVPGDVYTVVFWLKPLQSTVARGRVGDTYRGGWGPVGWTTAPAVRWQRFEKRLRAERSTELLAIVPKSGPTALRLDGVKILRAVPAPSGDSRPRATVPPAERAPAATTSAPKPPARSTRSAQTPAASTPSRQAPPASTVGGTADANLGTTEQSGGQSDGGVVTVETPTSSDPLVEAFRGTFGSSALGGGFNENQRWRLAFWQFMLRESVHHPFVGVGFGAPADFVWRGVRYDARRDPSDPNDVTPPHNSFVNLIFRTGLLGAIPFFALVGVGVVRLGRALREVRTPDERGRLLALALIGVFIGVIACFNGALEGPFMGMFFWTVLGLMLLSPQSKTSPE